MKTFRVQLPEPTALKLEEAAMRLTVSAEELMVLSVEEKLTQLDDEFRSTADYVFQKNADLYDRFA